MITCGRTEKWPNSGWIPVALASSGRFSVKELTAIERVVEENRGRFLEAWHELFCR
jgi:hypothetical protein